MLLEFESLMPNSMHEIARLDQYRYVLNSMKLVSRSTLANVAAGFRKLNINIYDHGQVYLHARFNDPFEAVTQRLWHSASKQTKRPADWTRILEQYFFLFLDLAPTCCQTGDIYLCRHENQLLGRCDFCDNLITIEGRPLEGTISTLPVSRPYLIERFGSATEQEWAHLRF